MKTLDRNRSFGKLIATGSTYKGARYVQDGYYFNNRGELIVGVGADASAPKPRPVEANPEPATASDSPALDVNWRELHWMKQVQLAKQITGKVAKTAAEARAVLEAAE